MNKLYGTDVYCEWVFCLHLPSIFWNSFQETEITTISRMMWKKILRNHDALPKLSKNLFLCCSACCRCCCCCDRVLSGHGHLLAAAASGLPNRSPKHRHVWSIASSIFFGYVIMTQCDAVFRNHCFAERFGLQICNVFVHSRLFALATSWI